MPWWGVLSGGLGGLLLIFASGVPIFVGFLLINLAGVLFVIGPAGFGLVANSLFDTTNIAALSSVPLFILMGEILFRSGSIEVLFRSVDTLIGRVRGRQYVLSTALAVIFGALSGSAMGVAAMMSRSLYPTMTARGYDPKLSMGLILAGASLAPVIPPSVLVVIVATLADVSVARLLIAGILPGLVLAALFLIYAFVRIGLNPALAPESTSEEHRRPSAREVAVALLRMIPFALIIFSVMGFILLGVATPSEAAATGVLGSLLASAYNRRLGWRMLRDSFASAAFITSMIMIIMASSNMFGQLLAFTGATQQLAQLVATLEVHPYVVLGLIMLVVFVMCMFIDQVALMLILVPILQPILGTLGFDPIWFWTLMLLNLTVGGITPPFGYTMFAFKGGAPEVKLSEIFAAVWPFVGLFLLAMVLIMLFPALATFLPSQL